MRIRFSIRDLLWLTFVAALAVGWWVDRNQLLEDNREMFWQALKAVDKLHQLQEERTGQIAIPLKNQSRTNVEPENLAADSHLDYSRVKQLNKLCGLLPILRGV